MSHHHLSDEDYAHFRELVAGRTGLLFGEKRRQVLSDAVTTCGQQAGFTTLRHYAQHLHATPTESEHWDRLIRLLTIGETYFFRDPQQLAALRQPILPELIERHRQDRELRIWSAGCSTGEEPYTLAILLREALPDLANWRLRLLATDLNRESLRHAVVGRYRNWSFRETSDTVRDQYFTPVDDGHEIKPEIRAMPTFAYRNLVVDDFPSATNGTEALDLILCRNVTIYLPEAAIRSIAARFWRCLVPGGWLLVGPSETHLDIYRDFTAVNFPGATAYRKPADHDPAAPSAPAAKRQRLSNAAPAFTPPAAPAPAAVFSFAERPAKPRAAAGPPAAPNPAPDPDEAFQRGAKLLQQRRHDEARQCFLACLKSAGPTLGILAQLARLEAGCGRLPEARDWATRAITVEPLNPEIHYTLALILQEQGNCAEAVASFKKALYLNPEFILAHHSVANLYEKMAADKRQVTRHRHQAVRLASKLPPGEQLPGGDGKVTAADVLRLGQAR